MHESAIFNEEMKYYRLQIETLWGCHPCAKGRNKITRYSSLEW